MQKAGHSEKVNHITLFSTKIQSTVHVFALQCYLTMTFQCGRYITCGLAIQLSSIKATPTSCTSALHTPLHRV